jgi:hypothetical protein
MECDINEMEGNRREAVDLVGQHVNDGLEGPIIAIENTTGHASFRIHERPETAPKCLREIREVPDRLISHDLEFVIPDKFARQ